MKPIFYIACTLLLSAAVPCLATETEGEPETVRAWINAPKEGVGVRIEDWVEYLGPEYSIDEPSAFKEIETGNPMSVLTLSDGSTRARFMVNLTTSEHRLVVVASKSPSFLREMGVDEIPIEKGTEIRLPVELTAESDVVEDELNIQLTDEGHLAAIWIYYWD